MKFEPIKLLPDEAACFKQRQELIDSAVKIYGIPRHILIGDEMKDAEKIKLEAIIEDLRQQLKVVRAERTLWKTRAEGMRAKAAAAASSAQNLYYSIARALGVDDLQKTCTALRENCEAFNRESAWE